MREMKPGDDCWRCRHLTSAIHSRPPVFCRAYPAGDGIPFEILAGVLRHDRLLGNEKAPVFFEPKEDHG